MGAWAVIEYRRSSGRKIKVWEFQSFSEAEKFRANREELYRAIGFQKKRGFTPALPKISAVEMKLFESIIASPDWMSRVKSQFLRSRRSE